MACQPEVVKLEVLQQDYHGCSRHLYYSIFTINLGTCPAELSDCQPEGATSSLLVYVSGCAQCFLGSRSTQHVTRVKITEHCSV